MNLHSSRKKDLHNVQVANRSYINILKYIRKLNGNTENFKRVNGRLVGFDLAKNVPGRFHTLTHIRFLDRETFDVRGTVNAKAVRVRKSVKSYDTKCYLICIYFDAPKRVKSSTRLYNRWLMENLESIFSSVKVQSSYVHEFIHVLDYRRISSEYLVSRSSKKSKETEQKLQTSKKRDFSKYINDPLELNAYFCQGINEVIHSEISLNYSLQELVEVFMNDFLKKSFTRNLTEENYKRIMKRAAVFFSNLKN